MGEVKQILLIAGDAATLAPCGWNDADDDVSGEMPVFTPNRPAGPNFPDNFAHSVNWISFCIIPRI